MDPHPFVFQFLHQSWRGLWRILRGFPQTGSAFRTSPEPSCRRCSRRQMGVWPLPSRARQIVECTEEQYSRTERLLCHSLKPKACGSVGSKKKKLLNKFPFLLRYFVVLTNLSRSLYLVKVVVVVIWCCAGHFLSVDDVLCIIPFTVERLITEVILSFWLRAKVKIRFIPTEVSISVVIVVERPTMNVYWRVLRGNRYAEKGGYLMVVRHWPPKLFVFMTLALHFPDTTSNLETQKNHLIG